jgi:glycosyltransferase involved in cell wall biosynthesis
VAFLGPLDRSAVVALLDGADLLAHPSLEESFGNTLIEAMARGTPVLGGFRSGAVPWVLDEGRAGVLCDVRDAEALAAAAHEVLSDPARWRALSAAGLDRVRGAFTLSRVADAYLTEYERIKAKG